MHLFGPCTSRIHGVSEVPEDGYPGPSGSQVFPFARSPAGNVWNPILFGGENPQSFTSSNSVCVFVCCFFGEDCSSNFVHQDRRVNLWNQTAQVVGGVIRFEKSLLPAEMGGEQAPL